MKLIRKSLHKWIEAAIILVVAILLIIAGANINESGSASQKAVDDISTVIGIVLIVCASLSLIVGVFAAIKIKKNLAVLCAPGAALLALGISLVVDKYAGEIIIIVLRILPYLLIALGGLIIVDSIFNLIKILRSKEKKSALLTIPAFIYGIIALVLGILSVGGNNAIIPENVQVIIVGILLIIYAVIVVTLTFVKLPKAILIVDKEE